MTSQHIPLHYLVTAFNGDECFELEQIQFTIHSILGKRQILWNQYIWLGLNFRGFRGTH